LHRSDAYREKIIAANVTQIAVVAAEPLFSDECRRALLAQMTRSLRWIVEQVRSSMLPPPRANGWPPYRDRLPRAGTQREQMAHDCARPAGHSSVLV
jgi:hypothetical protein